MDSQRFFIIVGVSFIFIILFCGDNIEGVENEETSSTDGGESEEGGEVDSGKIFGQDCITNCQEYAHECEILEEKNEESGNMEKTYGNVENCKNGSLPEQKCEDDKWKCKKCNPGFTLSNDNMCEPESKAGYGFSLCIVITILLTPILFFAGLKLYEKIDMNPYKSGPITITR